MIYQNDKIRIRPFEKADATDRYRQWFHDADTTRYNSHGLFAYTPEQARAFVAALEGDRSRIIWAIEVVNPAWINEASGEIYPECKWIHVGNVSLQSINLLNRSAELAVVIGEAEGRGKGYGLQACEWVVKHAFRRLGLNRVWTGTAETNVAMRRVCEKLGMLGEGRFKQGMFLDGRFVDVIAYGLTAAEYFGRA